MYCTNCGKSVPDGSEFCTSCGNSMTETKAQKAPEKKMGKKLQPKLMIVIIGAVLLLAGAALVLVLAGVFDSSVNIVGQWVNDERMEIMAFGENGDVELITARGDFNGAYSFDRNEKKGEIQFDDELTVGGIYGFELDGEGLEMDIEDVGEFAFSEEEAAAYNYAEGQWYCDSSMEVLEIDDEGGVKLTTPFGKFEGTCNAGKGDRSGTITFETTDIGDVHDFTINGDKMDIGVVGGFDRVKDGDKDYDFDDYDASQVQGIGFVPNSVLLGIWYEESGIGTFAFEADGICRMEAMGLLIEGAYTFDAQAKTGEMTMEIMGNESTQGFAISDSGLEVSGSVMTRDYVEPKELTDIMEDIDLDLN